MGTVGIWSRGETLAQVLEARLGRQFDFIRADHPALFAQWELARRGLARRDPNWQDLDLLVIAPDAVGLAGAGVLRPRLALLPGNGIALCGNLRATSAVSYGLGRQNSLTLSSMDGGSVSVCLQRELLTLSGRTVERQEWVLPYDKERYSTEEFLCLVGALLLLDQQLS